MLRIVVTDRQDGVNRFTLFQRQHIDQRLATRAAAGVGHFIHFQPVHFAAIGEQQHGVVCRRYQQVLNYIFIFHRGGRLAATTTALGLIIRQRLRLGVTRARHGHDHVFFSDQIFNREIQVACLDLSAAIIAKLITHGVQLFPDHFHQPIRRCQNLSKLSNFLKNRQVFIEQLLGFKARQTVQT